MSLKNSFDWKGKIQQVLKYMKPKFKEKKMQIKQVKKKILLSTFCKKRRSLQIKKL